MHSLPLFFRFKRMHSVFKENIRVSFEWNAKSWVSNIVVARRCKILYISLYLCDLKVLSSYIIIYLRVYIVVYYICLQLYIHIMSYIYIYSLTQTFRAGLWWMETVFPYFHCLQLSINSIVLQRNETDYTGQKYTVGLYSEHRC